MKKKPTKPKKKNMYYDTRIDDEYQGCLDLSTCLQAINETLTERDGFDEVYITIGRVYLTEKQFEELPEGDCR